jgi:hypothetical protein
MRWRQGFQTEFQPGFVEVLNAGGKRLNGYEKATRRQQVNDVLKRLALVTRIQKIDKNPLQNNDVRGRNMTVGDFPNIASQDFSVRLVREALLR